MKNEYKIVLKRELNNHSFLLLILKKAFLSLKIIMQYNKI